MQRFLSLPDPSGLWISLVLDQLWTHVASVWACLPEPLSLVVKWARVAPVGGLVELGQQGLAGLLAGVVGKLHSNRFCSTAGLLAVQPFDGFFCLDPLIKADESHPS